MTMEKWDELLTELYKEARSKKLTRKEIKDSFKEFIINKVEEIDRGILNKLCGLDSTNTDIDKLSLDLVIRYDEQYEKRKTDNINMLNADTEIKKKQENDEAWGFVSIFLPFIIGGIIGFLFNKDINGFITGGFMFYLPITVGFISSSFIIGLISLIIEIIILDKIPNEICKILFILIPGIGAFIWQIVNYIKSKNNAKKAMKENSEYIKYVENDYNNVDSQNYIESLTQSKIENANNIANKNNQIVLGTILTFALIIGCIFFYTYLNTPSKNWTYDKGKYYYLDENGNKITNTMINDKLKKYYVDSTGARVTNNWVEFENNLYHFDNDGIMKKNKFIDNTFYVNKEGKLERNKYVKAPNKRTYYLGEDGRIVKNAKTPDGRMADKYGAVY